MRDDLKAILARILDVGICEVIGFAFFLATMAVYGAAVSNHV